MSSWGGKVIGGPLLRASHESASLEHFECEVVGSSGGAFTYQCLCNRPHPHPKLDGSGNVRPRLPQAGPSWRGFRRGKMEVMSVARFVTFP